MASNSWRALGQGTVLGALRKDLRAARASVVVLGPWIDDYFASEVLTACHAKVSLRVLTRPTQQMFDGFVGDACAAAARLRERGADVRQLAGLHAKVILVDDAVAYCGSTNWYRHSLEHSVEVTLRGPASGIPSLLDEVETAWQRGTDFQVPRHDAQPARKPEGFLSEVVDPIAEEKLRSTPGAFVLRKKDR